MQCTFNGSNFQGSLSLFKPLPIELGAEGRRSLQLPNSFTALASAARSAWGSAVAGVRVVKAAATPKSYTLSVGKTQIKLEVTER